MDSQSSKVLKKSARSQGIQVIARAADILRILKKENNGLSLGQIAGSVGLPRSTVQRIVNSLIAEGLVMASSNGGDLRLGPEIQSLAAAGRIDVAQMVRPILTKLSKETGETVDLAVFRNDHMVFVDQVVGTHRLRTVSAPGETFPMSVTANGKAVLALLTDDLTMPLVTEEIQSTKGKTKSLSEIMAEIGQIRQTGIAWDQNEHTDGISAVGCAFQTPSGLIYAISIPAPSQRFDTRREALATALRGALENVQEII